MDEENMRQQQSSADPEQEMIPSVSEDPEDEVKVIDLYSQNEKVKEEEAAEEVLRAKKHRKKVIRITAVVTALAVASCGVFYVVQKRIKNKSGSEGQMPAMGLPSGMDASGMDVVTASGTTSIGMVLDTLDLDTTDLDLKIEKVYLSNRDEVEEGDPILKISDDSIASARTTLEQTYQSAQYAYDLNQLQENLDRISAQETYDQSLVTQKYAQQDYDATVAEAQAKVDDLQEQVDDQQELVDKYTAAVADENYYRDYYKVDELYAELEKNFALQMKLYGDKSNGIADIISFRSAQKAGTTTTTTGAGQGMPSGQMPAMNGNSNGGSGTTTTNTTTTTTGSTTTTDTTNTTNTDTNNTNTDTNNTNNTNTDTNNTDTNNTDTNNTNTNNTNTDTNTDTNNTNTDINNTTTTPDIMVALSAEGAVVSEDVSSSGAPTNAVIQGTGGTASGMPSSGSTSGTSGSSSSSSDLTLTDPVSTTSSSSSTSSASTGTMSGMSTGVSNTGSSLTLNNSDLSQYPLYAGYVMLDGEVTEETKEYEQALEDAENAQANAATLLKQATTKLKSLQLQLRTATTDLTTTTEEAKETLNTANAEAAAAKETYETSIRSIENTASTLEDTLDTAKENLDAFEEAIGDGYFYTSTPGTIMMVGVEEGESLTSDMMIAAYTDASSMTVTASVEQGSIASISVGDTCYVYVEDAGVYEGTVSSINPETQSNSRTSVYYSVIVTLDGDVSDLSENLSATVYFGDDASEVMQFYQQQGQTVHTAAESSDAEPATEAGIDAVFSGKTDAAAGAPADGSAPPDGAPQGDAAGMMGAADNTEGGAANE